MNISKKLLDELTYEIIGCCINVVFHTEEKSIFEK